MAKFVVLCITTIIINLLNSSVNVILLSQCSVVSYSRCIHKVFKDQLAGESVLLVLPKFHTQMSDQFAQIIHGSHAVTIVDKNQKTTATIAPLARPSNILFLTTGRLDLIHSISYLKSKMLWNPIALVTVILRNEFVIAKPKSLLNMREMKKIFKLFMKERSLKVNVITFDENHVPTIFAWFPFDDDNDCSNRVQIIQRVGKCLSDGNGTNNSYMIKTNHTDLPIIPTTFNGCPLHITARRSEPYTICDDDTVACDNGIEIRLFESVSESLKLSLQLKVEEKVDEIMYGRILRR